MRSPAISKSPRGESTFPCPTGLRSALSRARILRLLLLRWKRERSPTDILKIGSSYSPRWRTMTHSRPLAGVPRGRLVWTAKIARRDLLSRHQHCGVLFARPIARRDAPPHATLTSQIHVPLQVHAELLVGAAKSANPERNHARVIAFLAPFAIAWPDAQIEAQYIAIRTSLEAAGSPISEADLWIAAAVRAASGTIVTNNLREFSRVPDLLVEDWTVT